MVRLLKFLSICVVISISIVGCRTTVEGNLLVDGNTIATVEPSGSLAAGSIEVIFVDVRTDVSDRPLQLPGISGPGDYDAVSPGLEIEIVKEAFLEIVEQHYQSFGDKDIQIVVYLKKLDISFSSNGWKEDQYVYAELIAQIIEDERSNESQGVSWTRRRSPGLRISYDTLIQHALINAYISALNEALVSFNS